MRYTKVCTVTDGHSQLEREAILFQKFNRGTITPEELREYAAFTAKRKSKESYKSVEVLPPGLTRISKTQLAYSFLGKCITITQAEYEAHPEAFRR